jgi:hypothetical protein
MPFDGLTNEQLREQAPGIFALQAAPDVSERYAYLPSHQVIDEMRSLGMVPVQASTGRKRNPSGRAFAMHQIVFRPLGFYSRAPELGELTPQVFFLNSHDRTSPLAFDAGMERAVCTNGMRTTDAKLGLSFKVRHTGKGRLDELHAGMRRLIEGLDKIVEVANDWNRIELNDRQVVDFAKKAIALKGTTLAIEPEQLLTARRHMDEGLSLWRVFNRVQENIVKGGVSGITASGRRASLKRISTLAADVDFNRRLWTAASDLAAEVKPVSISVPALA